MIAGLSVQVITLFIFIILALDFSFRTWKRIRELGAQNALDPTHAKLRQSWPFKGFLIALSLSTLCIFTRSVYRVAELSEGWNGRLIKTQSYFIGLEGAIIGVAVLVLNAFHPGLCFREGYIKEQKKARKGWFGRKGKNVQDEASAAGSTDEVRQEK